MRLSVSTNLLEQLLNHLGKLKEFEAQKGIAERDALELNVLNTEHSYLDSALPVLTEMRFLATRGGDAEKLIQGKLAEAEAIVDKVRLVEEQSQGLLKSQKKVTTETGITDYARTFRHEAFQHLGFAGVWFLLSIFLIIFSGAYLLSNLGYTSWAGRLVGFNLRIVSDTADDETIANLPALSTPKTTAEAIHLTSIKLAFLSVLYFAMVFVGRAFRASMHNYTVNKHRYKALNTFELFVKGSEGNEETKNAILLQATGAIFAPQRTGYLSGEKGDAATTVNILDVLRKGGNPEA